MGLLDSIKKLFKPKVKPISVDELLEKRMKEKAKKSSGVQPVTERAPEAEVVYPPPSESSAEAASVESAKAVAVVEEKSKERIELEKKREELIKRREEIKKEIAKLDEKYANGEITAQQRDREYGKLLREAVRIRREISEIEMHLSEL